ncbi:MAG: hypothetical protein J6I45_12460 [Clostridia bacterium]|nr:hypothetical protein [Clostridia bacterium]
MTFSTASDIPRPVRLREATRQWANDSLHGVYGDDAMSHRFVTLDHIEHFEKMTDIAKYDAAIGQIAEQAPIRICPEERICGAATLGDAIYHVIPARYKGAPVFPSVSHLTICYEKAIRLGMDNYKKEIAQRLAEGKLDDSQTEFLHSLENVIESMRIWHHRYLEATEKSRPDLHKLLLQVPFSPARNFHEALQTLWFVFSFVRLCGNWPGIGRLDMLLGDYLERDLCNGVLTREEAAELLASFFIKGCEWIQSETPVGTGDAQHYQNIVLAGVDAEGVELTNAVTYLTLDILEELPISDYPVTVRLNKHASAALKESIARVMRHGGGIVAVYNEDLILQALNNLGYPVKEARSFANDGCWEVQIPGKTDFSYIPFDGLQIFNRVVGITSEEIPAFHTIEEVYAAYSDALRETVKVFYTNSIANAYVIKNDQWRFSASVRPTSVVSLFEEGCIEHACSYYDCGPMYIVRSPHIGGAPDVSNSLYAIEKLVFEEEKISFAELIQILRNNWEGEEELRLYVKNSYTYYGNDAVEADHWYSRLLNDFADMIEKCHDSKNSRFKFIPGVSSFGRQIDWLPNRAATAFGCRKGDILSGNDSPVPGTDASGATAIIKSYCKTDLVRQSCGAALDIKLHPEGLSGDNGIKSLVALIDGFLTLGGFFMQLDTFDRQTLLEAQKNPEKFKTLSVRVSGWNARFVTLNREWQNMIIERTAQNIN